MEQRKFLQQAGHRKGKLGAVNVGWSASNSSTSCRICSPRRTSTGQRAFLCLPLRGGMERFRRSSVQSRMASSARRSRMGSSTSSWKHLLRGQARSTASRLSEDFKSSTAKPLPTRSYRPCGLPELYFNSLSLIKLFKNCQALKGVKMKYSNKSSFASFRLFGGTESKKNWFDGAKDREPSRTKNNYSMGTIRRGIVM